jgi:hypothetical protein
VFLFFFLMIWKIRWNAILTPLNLTAIFSCRAFRDPLFN